MSIKPNQVLASCPWPLLPHVKSPIWRFCECWLPGPSNSSILASVFGWSNFSFLISNFEFSTTPGCQIGLATVCTCGEKISEGRPFSCNPRGWRQAVYYAVRQRVPEFLLRVYRQLP